MVQEVGRCVNSEFAADTLSSYWIGLLGAPLELMCDQGGEFQGRFARLCSMVGTMLLLLPASAKWRNGLAERHGAIIKLMMMMMMMKCIFELSISEGWEMRYCLHMCIAAKNRLARINGVAPIQGMPGIDPLTTYSVLDQVTNLKLKYVANQELTTNELLQRKAQIRAAAHASFVWLDASEKLRIGLNSRSRPPRLAQLHPGCQVWVWSMPSNKARKRL